MNVDLSDEARAQIGSIDAWWRLNRPAAPDLFTSELADALTLLARKLTAGAPYDDARRIRRVLLRRAHYHLYFMTEEQRVVVVAVWSVFRGRGPAL